MSCPESAPSSGPLPPVWVAAAAVVALAGTALAPPLGWLGLLPLGLVLAGRPALKGGLRWVTLAAAGAAICVAFGGFVLTTAVPNILAGGQTASGKHAMQTLRIFYWAQNAFRQERFLDLDKDGIPEFGSLGELVGADPLRGSGVPVRVPLLEPQRHVAEPSPAGEVTCTDGYCFVLYLPGGDGAVTRPAGEAPGDAIDLSERAWLAYAWPQEAGKTGRMVYFINQFEEILETDNLGERQGYSGPQRPPPFDAALAAPSLDAPLAPERARDGGSWRRWKGKQAKPLPSP